MPALCFARTRIAGRIGHTLPYPRSQYWTHEFLTGLVLCLPTGPPSVYAPIPLAPPLPPLVTGFVGFPVGRWVGLDAFPGQRDLAIYWACCSTSTSATRRRCRSTS
jgi:hypothetical protein